MVAKAPRRITDAQAAGAPAAYPEYSTVNPWNCVPTSSSDSRMLITYFSQFYLHNGKTGGVIKPLRFGASSQPRWHSTKANELYFIEGNQLRLANVENEGEEIIAEFSDYGSVSTKGEGDMRGSLIALAGDNTQAFVYDTQFRKLRSTNAAPQSIESLYLTPSGKLLVSWADTTLPMQLFGLDGQHLLNLPVNGHKAVGTRNGKDVLIWCSSNDSDPDRVPCDNGVVMIDLETGKQTCLMPLPWGLGMHFCCTVPDHVLVSTFIPLGTTLPTDGPYSEKIFDINLVTGHAEDIARHGCTVRDESDQPRAVISPDGRLIVFRSNMGGSIIDTWLIELDAPQISEPVSNAEERLKTLLQELQDASEGLTENIRKIIERYS